MGYDDILRKFTLKEKKSLRLIGEQDFLRSAVLVLLAEQSKCYYLIFEKRSSNIRQPGECCFPGGHYYPLEETVMDAARRETREELGIGENRIKEAAYFGSLLNNNRLIDVCTGRVSLEEQEIISFNPDEVEKIIMVPLDEILAAVPEIYPLKTLHIPGRGINQNSSFNTCLPARELGLPERYHRPWAGKSRTIFLYRFQNEIVWGITAEILHDFCEEWKKAES